MINLFLIFAFYNVRIYEEALSEANYNKYGVFVSEENMKEFYFFKTSLYEVII